MKPNISFGVHDKNSTFASNSGDSWPSPPQWTTDHKSILLSEQNNTEQPPDQTLNEIIENSSKFPIPFPIETVRCNRLKEQVSADVLTKNINSTYPVIHESVLFLCAKFLLHQKKYGSNTGFYKDMSLLQLIDRLLKKRAVSFTDTEDYFLLLNGTEGLSGWEAVGTSSEKPPLTLENCLSYDEMRLSALLSVSSHTCFINNGTRRNRGIPERDLARIEQTGVIIGLIGTRLTKRNVMEFREIVKSQDQNTHANGYGKNERQPSLQQVFSEFYGDTNATYTELLSEMKKNKARYIKLYGGENDFFDTLMYKRRLTLSFDTLLIEANDRAKKEEKQAFVHVVGIGLGVWKICDIQNRLFSEIFAERLEFLKGVLTNISDVYFAYIFEKTLGPYQNGDKIGRITVHLGNKDPHDKLTGDHEGKFLVVSYAWDGNALPGNEFWVGSLDSSSDPAAACSTQVTELHNAHINGKLRGNGLRVATLQHGLVTFQQYQELHKND